MKFLIDAQLPKMLADLLKHKGHDALHTIDLPYKNHTKDSEILNIARSQGRIVITKDIDFLNSFLIKKEPERLILITTGNITNKELLNIFSLQFSIIEKMLKRSNLIEINNEHILEHT